MAEIDPHCEPRQWSYPELAVMDIINVRTGHPTAPRSPFCHDTAVFDTPPLPRPLPSSVAFVAADTAYLRALFYMGALRVACAR